MAAAQVVADLLSAGPKLRIVVTSREVLHLSGEQEYSVPPLRLPEPTHLPSLDTLSQYDAVALFIQRARAVLPSFEVTNENAPAVAEICVRLDGLPLAIELAAARVKLFPADALLARLDHRLRVLKGGARDLPERQQTLRGAIDWSYDLLSAEERTLFMRLGAFIGGGTYEAAESVSGTDVGLDVLEGIESLVDKSLVRHAQPGPAEPRVWMLETIREYAVERLEQSGDGPDVLARHASLFCALAEEAEPKLTADDQAAWLDRIELEHDNLRAAMRRSIDGGHTELAMRTASALWRFWQLRGHLSEGRAWLTEILALPECAMATALRASTLTALAGIAYWQTDYAAAGPAYEEALSIYRELDDQPGVARTLYSLAYIRGIEGDLQEAESMVRESGRISEVLGDELGVAFAHHMGAAMVGFMGRLDEGLEESQEAAATFRRLGERFGLANALQLQSSMYRTSGRFADARAAAQEELEIFRQAGNASGMAMALGGLAALMIEEGNLEDGVRVAGAADAVEESVGGRAPTALRGYEDARDVARPLLGEEATQRAWEEGRRMSFDRAMDVAMGRPPT
jgi:predicted ATPase